MIMQAAPTPTVRHIGITDQFNESDNSMKVAMAMSIHAVEAGHTCACALAHAHGDSRHAPHIDTLHGDSMAK